jgi:putative PIN family toxin of toxin-antitoxin system
MNKLRAVIDTNVLIKTINRSNSEFFIYKSFIDQQFEWVVSTSILDEYEEKLTEFYSPKTALLVTEILCTASNVIFAEPHFQWNIITEDPDDNKFADLAISSNVHCLVSFDRHFNVFKKLDFPRLSVMSPQEFEELLQSQKNQ